MDPKVQASLMAHLDEAIERIKDAEEADSDDAGLSLNLADELDKLRVRAGLPYPFVEYGRQWPNSETERDYTDVTKGWKNEPMIKEYHDMLRDGTRSAGMPSAGWLRYRWPTGEAGGEILWILEQPGSS